MSVYDTQSEGSKNSPIDGQVLAVAAAGELTSPLVLIRQLALAISSNGLTEAERIELGNKLTLTSERALRLAANLNMSSPQQQALPLEPVNPVSVCRDVVHELSPLFAAHGRKITLQARSRMPLLVANRQLLQQILLSFADNALHYGSAERPVKVIINGHGDHVRVGVRDYGPALPNDLWRQLDGRISRRAAAPLASRPQVSGTSLIAVRRLAELMESTVGTIRHRNGATFYIDMHVSRQTSLL